jgi:hypothetical protein
MAVTPADRCEHGGERGQRGDGRIGDDQRATHAEIGQIEADFSGDAGAEPEARRGHFEGVFVVHGESLARLAAHARLRIPTCSVFARSPSP